jgi:hypothetical protein
VRTVTLTVHDRLAYTARTIGTLASMLISGSGPIFDKVVISVDPGNDDVVDFCDNACQVFSNSGIADCAMYVNGEKLGVAGNALSALTRAFEVEGSDMNLAIEDDALLTTDAGRLACWYQDEAHDDRYLLLSMCNHRDFGRGANPGGIPDDASYVLESPRITAPFAWCTTKKNWPFIAETWDTKKLPPNGWDFSLSYAMRLHFKRALHPVVSRCENIGEFGGVHETPDSFRATQTGLLYSDGAYDGPYKIVGRIPSEELLKLDDWMVSEFESEKIDGRAKQSRQ